MCKASLNHDTQKKRKNFYDVNNNKMICNDKLIHVRKQHKKCLKQFPLLHRE